MPISVFKCSAGHMTEKIYLSRLAMKSRVLCGQRKCGRMAFEQVAMPAVVGTKLQGWNEGEVKHIQSEALKIMAKEEKSNARNQKRRG